MTSVVLRTAQALSAVRCDTDKGCWRPENGTTEIVLPVTTPGWYSIEGQIELQGDNRCVTLVSDTGMLLTLPLTLKGRLLDVFYLPAGTKALRITLQAEELAVFKCDIDVAPVSQLRRLWRMLRRVLLSLIRQPARRRQGVALHWYSIFGGLEQAYRKAGQLRAWHSALPYADWIRLNENATFARNRKIAALLRQAEEIAVVVYGAAELAPELWQRSVDSVMAQAPHLPALHLLAARLPQGLVLPEGVHCYAAVTLLPQLSAAKVLMLRAGAVLSPLALAWWRLGAGEAPFSYSDHDYLAPERCQPQFKPDWSLELLRSTHYTGDVVCTSVAMLAACGWLAEDWQQPGAGQRLLLRLAEQLQPGQQAGHIAAVLWHDVSAQTAAEPGIVEAHLNRLNIVAQARPGPHGTVWVDYALASSPLVSIIVPTRDMLELLAPCIDSVLSNTAYPAFEILIVDNQSSCAQTLAYMQQVSCHPAIRVIRYDQPFNYAAINNFAVEQAKGELICLLNNDTEVISALWLQQMVALLLQPEVGVVGARLLYSDRRVQHGGDVVGPGGCADHLHNGIAEHAPGYMKRAVAAQDLSAVTAACLLTPKALFTQLGGLNAGQLAVAFNDVDYCLRVREAGSRVVYTPHALLYHHESVSRGKDDSAEKAKRARAEADYMRQRWQHIMQHDPFYNPNLNYQRADFTLSREPGVKAPWQR